MSLDKRSIQLRSDIIKALAAGGRGHLGAAFSLVEILRVLYDDILRFDPSEARWEKRDRFILSKGHGCLALYAVLADKGFFPKDELWKFCKFDGVDLDSANMAMSNLILRIDGHRKRFDCGKI